MADLVLTNALVLDPVAGALVPDRHVVVDKGRIADGSLVFASADTLDMQMAQLKEGLSNGQVGQRPFQMGYLAMQRLLDLKNGKTLQDPEYTGLDVCTSDNADTCLGQ